MQVKVSSLNVLFCLTGCLYQIYGITKSYLQFKVRHDVAYDYSTSIELPAIDIMVPMFVAINWTKVLAYRSEGMQDYCEKFKVQYEGSNLSIANLNKSCEEYIYLMFLEKVPFDDLPYKINIAKVKEHTVDLREQMLKIHFSSLGSFRILWGHCKSTRYFNGLAIFMRIFCLNGTKPFSVNTNYVSMNEGIVAYLDYSFGLHFGIRFSDPADLPEYDPSKYFMITSKPGSFPLITISFVKTVMSSLEYPYETNCLHYNRDKSLSKCMTEYSLNQSTPYLDKYSVHEWDELIEFFSGFNGNNKGDRHNDGKKVDHDELDAFINCNQQATQCEKTIYSVEGKLSEESNDNANLIIIEPSRKVNMYRSVHPILPWNKYVIYIGSIIGFWFGVSMYDLIFKIFISIKTRFSFKCK